jgi:hypothetical protein
MLMLHYDELNQNKSVMTVNPDDDAYMKWQELGALVLLVMYLDDVAIGYSVNYLCNSIHYVDTLICKNDLFYIHPDHRKGRNGIKLIAETKIEASELGAKLMMWHCKEDTPMRKLLERTGCKVEEITYSEVI